MKKNILKNLFLAGSVIFLGFSQLDAAPSNTKKRTTTAKKMSAKQRQAQLEAERQRAEAEARARQERVKNYYMKPRSGVFLGLGVGAGAITREADVSSVQTKNQSGDYSLGLGAYWEGKLGWQQYITRNHGVRAYVSYDQAWGFPGQMTTLGLKALTRDYVFIQRVLVNADYLWDLIAEGRRRVGIYAGVYAGWGQANQRYYLSGDSNSDGYSPTVEENLKGDNYNDAFMFGINAGVSITFAKRNRVEIGAKVPLLDLTSKEYYENTGNGYSVAERYPQVDVTWKTPVFTIGYHFIF